MSNALVRAKQFTGPPMRDRGVVSLLLAETGVGHCLGMAPGAVVSFFDCGVYYGLKVGVQYRE